MDHVRGQEHPHKGEIIYYDIHKKEEWKNCSVHSLGMLNLDGNEWLDMEPKSLLLHKTAHPIENFIIQSFSQNVLQKRWVYQNKSEVKIEQKPAKHIHQITL